MPNYKKFFKPLNPDEEDIKMIKNPKTKDDYINNILFQALAIKKNLEHYFIKTQNRILELNGQLKKLIRQELEEVK